MSTYTNRRVEYVTVKSVEGGVAFDNGWGTAGTPEVRARLKPGMVVGLEQRGNTIVGWLVDDQWVMRKSDEELDAERAEWKAKWEQEKREHLEANREDWTRREAALPDWIRARLEHFRATEESPGSFDREGWGYELIIAELAVMYLDGVDPSDYTGTDRFEFKDTPAIMDFAREQGTSGNQHGVAEALARAHLEGTNLAGTISALSPLTGKFGY